MASGAANPVMHFTAMAGISFTYSAVIPDLAHAVNISSLGILGISVVPVMLLFVVLLTSSVDRVRKQRALLDELFEQAPQAVVLMSVDNRVVRVNREFTRLLGYTVQETQGRRLSELIVPDDSQDEDQKYTDLVARGKRVDVEGVRKDDSRLHVSIIRVPVSVPGGQIAVYAIYRDIPERKRAEEALRQVLSRIESVLNSVADTHILFD
jgi:PAS domain S-box-containing protein